MFMTDSERLLTIGEVAELLRVSRMSVRRLLRAGAFPVIRTTQRRLGVRPGDVRDYIARRALRAAPTDIGGTHEIAGGTLSRSRRRFAATGSRYSEPLT